MYSELFELFFTSVGHAYLIAKRDPANEGQAVGEQEVAVG